jgi:hypothetical protein
MADDGNYHLECKNHKEDNVEKSESISIPNSGFRLSYFGKICILLKKLSSFLCQNNYKRANVTGQTRQGKPAGQTKQNTFAGRTSQDTL